MKFMIEMFYSVAIVAIAIACAFAVAIVFRGRDTPKTSISTAAVSPVDFDHGPDLVGGAKIGETAVLHDWHRGVTCWEFNGGMSCLPDRWLAEGGAP